MKVLIATTYLYNADWPEFTRNKTGFGIMLRDILDSVSTLVDVKFISHVITNGHGEKVIKHSWGDVLKSVQVRDVIDGINLFFKFPQSLRERAKSVYFKINKGFVRATIKEYKPDVVHIHGLGIRTLTYIEVCDELQVPYIVTLHGLIGLNETVSAPPWDKQLEKNFLIRADMEGIPVTVISTGMKKRIEKNYLHHEAKQIFVICNGTKVPYHEVVINKKSDMLDLRQQFNVKANEKIAVVIGSVSENKNQIQIVRAMATGSIKTPCQVFLCGSDSTNGIVQKEIHKCNLQDKVHLLGFVPQNLIADCLEQADLNIVASRNEGFGLSIIEAYAHGVPTVTFSDLDAVPDLYNPETMIKVDSRDDIALANGIEEALQRKWDSDVIKNFAQQFSLERMAKEYMKVYEKCVRP